MGKKEIAYINPKMLKWAREQTPFATVDDVANAGVKVSPEDLSKWENGEDYPSISKAKELAKLYRLPFASLYLSNEPVVAPKDYTDRRTIYSTIYEEPTFKLWSEISRIKSERENILELLNISDIESIDIPKFDNWNDMSFIVKTIREFLDIPKLFKSQKDYKSNSFNYFRQKFENKGIIVEQLFDVELEELKAMSIYKKELPIIAINNKDYKNAKTFSLFHELAHLIRRSSSLCTFDDNERVDEEEKICDDFASNILMDKDTFISEANKIINKCLFWDYNSISKLSAKFGVSVIAAFRRLHDLNLIGEDDYYNMYAKLKKEFEKYITSEENKNNDRDLAIPFYIRYLNKHGELIPRIIMSAQGNGALSYGEMVQYLDVKRKFVQQIGREIFAL